MEETPERPMEETYKVIKMKTGQPGSKGKDFVQNELEVFGTQNVYRQTLVWENDSAANRLRF